MLYVFTFLLQNSVAVFAYIRFIMAFMNTKFSVLIVEDEEAIRNGLVDLLVFHGYEAAFAVDGTSGLAEALARDFDLVVLDVMLPGKDGFSVCSELRRAKPEQLIIMLTAKTTEEDIIIGLSSGADDYVAKPFSVRELMLRIEAVLRRSRKARRTAQELVVADGICINTANLLGRTADGSELVFTRREIEIIQYLLDNPDRPVSRGELLDEVWGYARAQHIETRTVDIHIAKLRKKIEPNSKLPQYLITTRGEGYQLLRVPQGNG